jgi:phenazine biosynthesis protein phzE
MTATLDDLLDRVLAPDPPPYALLHRPETTGPGALELLVGTMSTADTLADVPLPDGTAARSDVLVLVPYRQVAERGYQCSDDGEPLRVLTVTDQAILPMTEAVRRLPEAPARLTDGHFDVSDDAYARIVQHVIDDEIGRGEGANFVIKRSYVADIAGYSPHSALSFFRRLLGAETGAHWTFLVHTGERTLVGATPERHISLADGTAVMTPISGTYRYPASGPELAELMRFLDDGKETDELYMVVDEELKMMARICETGGRVSGPYLREMARLAHTEYVIAGTSRRDPRDILRETMFSPAVTGSPLENACRVIDRYEPHGRGYYSGIAALIGRDDTGAHTLDSSILIRTADIDRTGHLEIGTGATLVRHSDPRSEVAETRAKAAALLAALATESRPRFGGDPAVQAALAKRNATIATFWLGDDPSPAPTDPDLVGRRVLVVDAEDTFTSMIGHLLRALGLAVTVRRYDEAYSFDDGYDLVVLGPGPGDPRDDGHPKIAHLRAAVDTLLATGMPFLAVCLSHQTLCRRLGLDLVRRPVPNQGAQRSIDLFGEPELVGFYNTFAARADDDEIDCPGLGVVQVCRDPATGEVHALRGPHFASLQFHAESVLTRRGLRIVTDRMKEVLRA